MAGIERFFEGKVKPRTEHSSTGHTRLKVFWSYSVCKLKFFFKQIDSTRYAAKIACQLYVNPNPVNTRSHIGRNGRTCSAFRRKDDACTSRHVTGEQVS